MDSRKTILLAVITSVAGVLTCMFSAKKSTARGVLMGASVGAAAGYCTAFMCRKLQEENIDYYTELSPFYEKDEWLEYL